MFSATSDKIISNDVEKQYFEGYVMQKIADNMVQINFDQGFEGEIEDVKMIVQRIGNYCVQHQPVLLLVVYSEDNIFSKEARQYIASKEVNTIVKAEALVINSMALRIMGNFYLKVNKPARESRLFNDRDIAFEWLSKRQ
jgi:hypothetical protein